MTLPKTYPAPEDVLAAVAELEERGPRKVVFENQVAIQIHGGSTNEIARALSAWPSVILPTLRELVEQGRLRVVRRGPYKVYSIAPPPAPIAEEAR